MPSASVLCLRSGQALFVVGLIMAVLAATGYFGVVSCGGWQRLVCFFKTLAWVIGMQVPAAILQWIGLARLPKDRRGRGAIGMAMLSTTAVAVVGIGWLSIAFFSYSGDEVAAP